MGSEQIASQHLAGGGDFRRIAERTDRPNGHLDPLSGAIGKLRPEQIKSLLRDRPRVVVSQELLHSTSEIIGRRSAEEAKDVESILVGRPLRAGTVPGSCATSPPAARRSPRPERRALGRPDVSSAPTRMTSASAITPSSPRTIRADRASWPGSLAARRPLPGLIDAGTSRFDGKLGPDYALSSSGPLSAEKATSWDRKRLPNWLERGTERRVGHQSSAERPGCSSNMSFVRNQKLGCRTR